MKLKGQDVKFLIINKDYKKTGILTIKPILIKTFAQGHIAVKVGDHTFTVNGFDSFSTQSEVNAEQGRINSALMPLATRQVGDARANVIGSVAALVINALNNAGNTQNAHTYAYHKWIKSDKDLTDVFANFIFQGPSRTKFQYGPLSTDLFTPAEIAAKFHFDHNKFKYGLQIWEKDDNGHRRIVTGSIDRSKGIEVTIIATSKEVNSPTEAGSPNNPTYITIKT